jgi:hypothetical protein
MSDWTLAADCSDTERDSFATLDDVFALDGEFITKDPLSRVLRIALTDRRYYLKRYTGAGKNPLRRWFARPRVCAEWENLQAFARWGIPTARLVAWGAERRTGSFIRGALITEEIRDTVDLAKMAQGEDPRLRDRAWVDRISSQLARITRTLHDHGFTHNDLKWRNLLVTSGDEPVVHLIDCPNGGFWPRPFLHYRIVKDLACLDKVARHQLSRTQRLRFLLAYLETDRLTPEGKRWARAIERAHGRRALRKRLGF